MNGILFHYLHFFSHSSLDLYVYAYANWAVDPIYWWSLHHRLLLPIGWFLSFLGIARNNMLLFALVLKLSIVHLMTPPSNFFGYNGSYKKWVFLKLLALIFSVTITMQFKLSIVMSSTSVRSTSRLTVILCFVFYLRNSPPLSYCICWPARWRVHQNTST